MGVAHMVDVKNDMEHLVRAEVARRREKTKAKDAVCWCALCETDIVALALNNLPPRYCRRGNFGYAASEGFADRVREAVATAVAKVSRRPKHRPGAPDRFRSEVQLEDFGLKVGTSLLKRLAERPDGLCGCEGCRADALAFALNRYPPKYGVSSPGRVSYQTNLVDFICHELGQVIDKARAVVCSNPNH